MSELKAYTFSNMEGRGLAEYYLKSEADKVIAEKDAENESLLQQNRELCQALQVMYSKEEYDKQKYKRCLDNAWWCRNSSNAYAWSASNLRGWKIAVYYDKKAELYRKWHKRWLELAEKFKEAK